MPQQVLLITGAAGNLGRKLAAHFRSKGHPLVLLDVVAQPADSSIETADFSRWDGWADRFAGVDCVIHMAANSEVHADWDAVVRHNIDATLNVFEAASRHGVKRVIFASSGWVVEGYEKSSGKITEEMSPLPINAYGASKLAGERIGRFFAETRGLSTLCFRIGACLQEPYGGPGLHLGLTPWPQQKWLSDGDLCQAYDLAVAAPDTLRFEVFNLVSDNRGMRWDMGKAERLLGFRAKDSSVPVVPSLKKRVSRWLKRMRGLGRPDIGPRLAR